jgi:hypothetical protein
MARLPLRFMGRVSLGGEPEARRVRHQRLRLPELGSSSKSTGFLPADETMTVMTPHSGTRNLADEQSDAH